MALKDYREFRMALRDIALNSSKLETSFDRVKCAEWVRKLSDLRDDDLECCRIRNEYAQFLRIQVNNNFLHGPFTEHPGSGELLPLAECLGNLINKQIPDLPKSGPIAPVVSHVSADGRAHVAAKQIPGGGVLCYLAVTPDEFKE